MVAATCAALIGEESLSIDSAYLLTSKMGPPTFVENGKPEAIFSELKYAGTQVKANMFTPPFTDRFKQKLVNEVTLEGVSISRLWTHAFSDDLGFLNRYHEKRNESDLVVSKWVFSHNHAAGLRFLTLSTTVDTGISVVRTTLEEAHRFCCIRRPGGSILMVYQISSYTPDITGAQSFRTEALGWVEAENENADCRITFWGKCLQVTSFFLVVRKMAEGRALREMGEAYQLMLKMLAEEICGKRLELAEPPPAAEAPTAIEDSGKGGGVVEALLLGVAVLVGVVTVLNLRTINRTAAIALKLSMQPASAWVGNSLGWNVEMNRRSGPSVEEGGGRRGRGEGLSTPPSSALSYLHSTHIAANDAELQAVRYRLVEQRSALDALEKSMGRMWWVIGFQGLLMLLIFLMVLRRATANPESKRDERGEKNAS